MITLNKLAKTIAATCIKSGRVTVESNHRAYLRQASVRLMGMYDHATRMPSGKLPQWSEYEVSAAEVICWMTAFLERLGCQSVEQLMRDVIAYRCEHPDRPRK